MKTITTTVTEKMISLYQPSVTLSAHGFFDEIEGEGYVNTEVYDGSRAQYEKFEKLAKKKNAELVRSKSWAGKYKVEIWDKTVRSKTVSCASNIVEK